MSDFTPIPGGWYIDPEAVVEGWSIENYDYDLLIAYMPKNDQWPWYSPADHDFLSEDERLRCWPELVEVYNPHPPTRTEWGTQDDEGSIVENHETDIEYALSETEQYDSQLMSRQVTEWNKADIPDGWEKF